MADSEDIASRITQQAAAVRDLKAAKASKEQITAAVEQLLALKKEFQDLTGQPYDAPKVAAPAPVETAVKEEKAEEAKSDEIKGPSKKELNKLAKKSKKEAHKDGATATSEAEASAPDANTPAAPVVPKSSGVLEVVSCNDQSTRLVCAVASALGVSLELTKSEASTYHLPYAVSTAHGSISGETNIARYMARSAAPSLFSLPHDSWLASQCDQWLDAYSLHADKSPPPSLTALLNEHLSCTTFLVGQESTLADLTIATLLNSNNYKADKSLPHLLRWQSHMSAIIPSTTSFVPKKQMPSKTKSTSNPSTAKPAADEGGVCPPLEGAIEGAVCTRFPPEPSGYLHIGHAKAVLLNQYYAQRYKGKLLVRFDDTNPSKEKEEFEENILADLATLQVKADSVSHTSDHFETCQEYARKLISAGLAYMDDTEQETMQAERMTHAASKHRDSSVETNLALFELLLKGDPASVSYCLRAKIDMTSVNGTMRDPVLYRYNATPHHKTGEKFKAYPTYDFACPIVDAIEGVTHAMRTTEYNDRDEQYHWLQEAMGLRKVYIYSYGKMNFVHTVLSKRKLAWFVEQGMVDGWFDPRFPTIQGCIRRGMNVEVLKNFIISQGASKRIITMEWDKFWSENKKHLEDIAYRFMAIADPDPERNSKGAVKVTVSNFAELYGDIADVAVTVPLHPQKPEMGQRVMRRSSTLLVETEDCVSFRVGEEVTFLRWGNFIIEDILKNDQGVVTSMHARHDPNATNFSKTKKLTWLALNEDVVPCSLVVFDHLISKAKLGDEEDFKNFVNPNTRSESYAVGDACLRTVEAGQIIQLERRGFFRCDVPYGGTASKPIVLFYIPDGKSK